MSVDIVDRTGTPVSLADYDEVIGVVRKFIVTGIIRFPPEFAVQLPSILRCLEQERALTGVVEELRKAKTNT